jgi:hypothetical protein
LKSKVFSSTLKNAVANYNVINSKVARLAPGKGSWAWHETRLAAAGAFLGKRPLVPLLLLGSPFFRLFF